MRTTLLRPVLLALFAAITGRSIAASDLGNGKNGDHSHPPGTVPRND